MKNRKLTGNICVWICAKPQRTANGIPTTWRPKSALSLKHAQHWTKIALIALVENVDAPCPNQVDFINVSRIQCLHF